MTSVDGERLAKLMTIPDVSQSIRVRLLTADGW